MAAGLPARRPDFFYNLSLRSLEVGRWEGFTFNPLAHSLNLARKGSLASAVSGCENVSYGASTTR